MGTGFINAPVVTLSMFATSLIYGILFEVLLDNFVVVIPFTAKFDVIDLD